MQSSVISTRATSLYGYQPTSMVFASKTATFWKKLQVSMGPRPHLSFCACKTVWFDQEWQVNMCSNLKGCMGPRPHLWFWAHIAVCFAQEYQDYMGSSPHLWLWSCKAATLGPELQVSVGPRSHQWFFHAKQRLLDQTTKTLRVPDMTCRFVLVQQRA